MTKLISSQKAKKGRKTRGESEKKKGRKRTCVLVPSHKNIPERYVYGSSSSVGWVE
jgi:hypothetical protein